MKRMIVVSHLAFVIVGIGVYLLLIFRDLPIPFNHGSLANLFLASPVHSPGLQMDKNKISGFSSYEESAFRDGEESFIRKIAGFLIRYRSPNDWPVLRFHLVLWELNKKFPSTVERVFKMLNERDSNGQGWDGSTVPFEMTRETKMGDFHFFTQINLYSVTDPELISNGYSFSLDVKMGQFENDLETVMKGAFSGSGHSNSELTQSKGFIRLSNPEKAMGMRNERISSSYLGRPNINGYFLWDRTIKTQILKALISVTHERDSRFLGSQSSFVRFASLEFDRKNQMFTLESTDVTGGTHAKTHQLYASGEYGGEIKIISSHRNGIPYDSSSKYFNPENSQSVQFDMKYDEIKSLSDFDPPLSVDPRTLYDSNRFAFIGNSNDSVAGCDMDLLPSYLGF